GFGRRHMEVSEAELTGDVLFQVGALEAFCRRHGTAVRYVKAHGALYNDLVGDVRLAAALVDAVRAYDRTLPVLTLPGSVAAATFVGAGLTVRAEGFPDRAYSADGTLVPRTVAGAVVSRAEEAAARGARMALGEPFEAHTGARVLVRVDTLCIHSDTPGAVGLARALRSALHDAGVTVRAFS
ncbi:MAG: LamB/YcsF family protein, partial [Nitrososphaerales archaeon]